MHFGIISAPVPGHLYPCCMLSIGLKLIGHKLTVINIPDSQEFVESLGIGFYPIGQVEFPKGSWHKRWNPARTGSNIWRDTRILKAHIEIARIMLRDLPQIIEKEQIDVLIVDHLQPQGSSLAEKARIPFITICSILPLHKDFSGKVPASFAWWLVKNTIWNRMINRLSHKMVDLLAFPYLSEVNKFRKIWGMTPILSLESSFSNELQLGVVPQEIDFPRPALKNYRIVGPPIIDRPVSDFPWEKLDGRKLVYASMGTIRNKIGKIFRILIKVFAEWPEFHLVVSKGAWNGGGINLQNLPENVVLVDYAPQLEILKKASLCISHAGPGTVLESIYYNVPLIAVPISDDQPAMAARIVYHNLGVRIPLKKFNCNRLKNAVFEVLNSDEITHSVKKMSETFRNYKAIEDSTRLILKSLRT